MTDATPQGTAPARAIGEEHSVKQTDLVRIALVGLAVAATWKAIFRKAAAHGIAPRVPDRFEYRPGMGIVAADGGRELRGGERCRRPSARTIRRPSASKGRASRRWRDHPTDADPRDARGIAEGGGRALRVGGWPARRSEPHSAARAGWS